MTLLTEATDVFAAAESSSRCVVAFLCKRQPAPADVFGAREREEIGTVLRCPARTKHRRDADSLLPTRQ